MALVKNKTDAEIRGTMWYIRLSRVACGAQGVDALAAAVGEVDQGTLYDSIKSSLAGSGRRRGRGMTCEACEAVEATACVDQQEAGGQRVKLHLTTHRGSRQPGPGQYLRLAWFTGSAWLTSSAGWNSPPLPRNLWWVVTLRRHRAGRDQRNQTQDHNQMGWAEGGRKGADGRVVGWVVRLDGEGRAANVQTVACRLGPVGDNASSPPASPEPLLLQRAPLPLPL
ncbi:hypothetical protein B0T17DRAFT_502466 [Bombardia bombarda]|uniref:Uncharacterized protein n=1 Tax=Bombardia bombarda TaxID=252184 RepID=A0AA40CEV2_9PEZI|nr:hypothetical protein B0T17DRAFT_502466 [Bombardia bombarda]